MELRGDTARVCKGSMRVCGKTFRCIPPAVHLLCVDAVGFQLIHRANPNTVGHESGGVEALGEGKLLTMLVDECN